MRYFLIGFMGSGKSKVGKLLSEELNFQFIDLDKFIEKEENRTIDNIFTMSGEKYFRNLEVKYLDKIIKKENIVVATGGGTATVHGLMEMMNDAGTTIYLKCSTDTLYDRLSERKSARPLIDKLSSMNLRKYIKNKVSERNLHYKKATHTITNNHNVSVKEIIKILR